MPPKQSPCFGPGPWIYVDFDDVLCETARGLLRVLKSDFGKSIAFKDIRSFDLKKSFRLSPSELSAFMTRVHKPDVLGKLRPVQGAVSVLKEWTRSGFKVCVVTGRPPFTKRTSRDWLDRHCVPYARLMFVNKYFRLSPGEKKTDAVSLEELSRMDFRLAIEDAPSMVNFLAERMSMPVIVFNRPWNAAGLTVNKPAAQRIFRCRTWHEIKRLAAAG